jgi:hypothetical protein
MSVIDDYVALTPIDSYGRRIRLGNAPHEEAVRRGMRDLLAGRTPVPRDAPFVPIDEGTARLLAHHGLHPLAVAAIARVRDFARKIPLGRASIHGYDERDGDWVCGVPMARGVEWQRVSILVRHLPETLHLALEERLPAPLERIVSHPALDGMGLEICGHQRLGKWQLLHLDEPPGCTRDQLEDVWRRATPGVHHHIGEAA